MKEVFLILLSLMLLTGCGTSAEQKRNDYEVCIFEKTREYWSEINKSIRTTKDLDFYRPGIEGRAKSFCIGLLK